VRQGPIGQARLARIDRKAAEAVRGVVAIFENPSWVAAVATNWWAADQAVERMKPAFRSEARLASSASVEAALGAAIESGDANTVFSNGEAEGEAQITGRYSAGLAPNAPTETLTATVRLTGDRLEVWAPTQAPGFARAAASRVSGIAEEHVTIYPMLVGGGYGRKLETIAIEQAVTIAQRLKRPVQLSWSRIEETLQDTFRPPAIADLGASLIAGGQIGTWRARIAVPATLAQVKARLVAGEAERADADDGSAVDGAAPPYSIPAVEITHVPVDLGIRTGIWRSGAHSYTCFFTECFIDELARTSNVEPLSFRMQMLSDNPRLARCLTTVAGLGGWDGGARGSMMGIAAHSCFGSHVATVVELEPGGPLGLRVVRVVSAVDCGQIVNPDIVSQLIQGGIVHGLSGALGKAIRIEGGLPTAIGFKDLGLPILADTPEIMVEVIESEEAPGGVTELGVPTVAPAIANAIFAATGQRLRSLPLALKG
jgi:isoquinoline 1-oxidoreductase beta subunit